MPPRRPVLFLALALAAVVVVGSAGGLAGARGGLTPAIAPVYPADFPSSPYFYSQWNLAASSVYGGATDWLPAYGPAMPDGHGVTVAVVDSGIESLPGMARTLPGVSLVGGDASDDHFGHGTAVAAVIGAADDGPGMAGMAPGVTLLPVQVSDATGTSNVDLVAEGIEDAVADGAELINVSLAGPVDGGMCAAVADATRAGDLVVAAAGNTPGVVGYPAACPGAVAVSALSQSGALADYSGSGSAVALAAPGGGGDGFTPGLPTWWPTASGWIVTGVEGTSFAAPEVTAALAQVMSAGPNLTPDAALAILYSSAEHLGTGPGDPSFGHGGLDVAAALSQVAADAGGASAAAANADPGPAGPGGRSVITPFGLKSGFGTGRRHFAFFR